jgi:hypothetical protein
VTRAQRIDAVCQKIRYQMPDTEEGDVMFLVLRQAVKDLYSKRKTVRAAAVKYLDGRIDAAEVCGVESEWVRRVLREGGIDLLERSEGSIDTA